MSEVSDLISLIPFLLHLLPPSFIFITPHPFLPPPEVSSLFLFYSFLGGRGGKIPYRVTMTGFLWAGMGCGGSHHDRWRDMRMSRCIVFVDFSFRGSGVGFFGFRFLPLPHPGFCLGSLFKEVGPIAPPFTICGII